MKEPARACKPASPAKEICLWAAAFLASWQVAGSDCSFLLSCQFWFMLSLLLGKALYHSTQHSKKSQQLPLKSLFFCCFGSTFPILSAASFSRKRLRSTRKLSLIAKRQLPSCLTCLGWSSLMNPARHLHVPLRGSWTACILNWILRLLIVGKEISSKLVCKVVMLSCLWLDELLGNRGLGCSYCSVKEYNTTWRISSFHRDPEFVFYDQLKQVMNAYRYGIPLGLLGYCLTLWQYLL